MAVNATPEQSAGVFGAIKQALGLFGDTNKAQGIDENSQAIPQDEYESSFSEVEVLQLTSTWRKTYLVYYMPIEKDQKLSFDYWIGKHRPPDGVTAPQGVEQSTDNLIFEAIETFLPIATRANPDPLVQADPSDIGQKLANDIKVALVYEADSQKFRRKLAKATRSWLLNRLGVVKVAWNPITKTIQTDVINPKKMIFDKDGYIDEGGIFRGEYEGEKKRASASRLIEMFPKKQKEILKKAQGKEGTKLDYIEWWYRGNDMFFTMDDDIVLGKYKNPNWNYDIEGQEAVEPTIDPETQEVLAEGQEATEAIPGKNHLKERLSPYRYLSIFSVSDQPHDNTGLITQNLALQDRINRRVNQIDQNVKSMNNGMVVSGSAFTEEQASQAAAALRKGVAIRVPNGSVKDAVLFPEKPALPGDVFESLRDDRAELRNIFGTSGSSPEGVKNTETVRGKVLINQMDASRIGGGITTAIEQLADAVYNLWVQFMFVYYDDQHFIVSAGEQAGMELIAIKNTNLAQLQTLDITVKEGSLIPKDPLTQRNEAIDLWSANAIDPLSLYKKLDFPDPDEATNQLILWQMLQKGQIQPQMYLPTFAMAGQQAGQSAALPTQEPGTGGPAVNPIGASQPGGIAPQPQQETESKQLIQQVPLQK